MENRTEKSDRLIAEYYEEHRSSIFFYIYRRINDEGDAEDLVQDAFLRLLEHRMMIRPDTLKYFLFTIVRNLLNDYLRRYYKRQEIDRYLYDMLPVSTVEPESSLRAGLWRTTFAGWKSEGCPRFRNRDVRFMR